MAKEKEQKLEKSEELNKALDALIDEVFAEPEAQEEEVEKSIDIAKDSKKTADAAVSAAPKAQKDEARGAGRPKQISDVPQTDMDGRRESDYDDSITENEGKEDEPEETEQSPSQDQTQEKKRMGGKPKAPAQRPFKKSEGEEEPVELSAEEWAEFQAFKKSQEEAKKAEELKKSQEAVKKAEELRKAEVTNAVQEAVEPLRKSLEEAQALIKSLSGRPQRAKSITGIEALEKSQDDSVKEPEAFSKSDMADAIFDLAKSKAIPEDSMYEYEMTGSISDPAVRRVVERKLQGK